MVLEKKLVDNLNMDGYFVYVLSRSKSKRELMDIFLIRNLNIFVKK